MLSQRSPIDSFTFMKVVIVGNGAPPVRELLLREIESSSLLIAADGGLHHCLDVGIAPHWIVGDLDSIPPQTLERSRGSTIIYRYPSDKSESDFFLALKCAERMGATNLHLFSSFGLKEDYSISNLLDAQRIKARMRFFSQYSEIVVLNAQNPIYRFEGDKPRVSLFSFDPATILTSTGLEWDLAWKSSKRPRLSLSNRAKRGAEIRLQAGLSFLCLDFDEDFVTTKFSE